MTELLSGYFLLFFVQDIDPCLVLPDVVQDPGGHPLLAEPGHPLDNPHCVVLQRGNITHMSHASLSLASACLADVLDCGVWNRLALQRTSWLVSDLLAVLLICAALTIKPPDEAPGTLASGD